MVNEIRIDLLLALFREVSNRYCEPAQVYVLGGGALLLLGSTRPTVDIDFFGNDVDKTDIQLTIDDVAKEMSIDVDAVPLDEFIPLDYDSTSRHRFITKYGNLDVFVFDPYSICISKLDRGFDYDIDDIVYLVRNGFVVLENLAHLLEEALAVSFGFDIDSAECRRNLHEVEDLCFGSSDCDNRASSFI